MRIKIAHHVFASQNGYRTVFCSGGISDSELRELESFSFGQTNDQDYISSLNSCPAYLLRKLKTMRWAVTRVFGGKDDEYGRKTLLFHSLIIEYEDWISQLECDIQPLINHPTLWKTTDTSAISIQIDVSSIPSEIKEEAESIVSRLIDAKRTIVVEENNCSFQTIRWVNRLLPDEFRKNFTYGYRVLTDGIDVALICLSTIAIRGSVSLSRRFPKSCVAEPLIQNRDDKKVEWDEWIEVDPFGVSAERQTNKAAIVVICTISVVGIACVIFLLGLLLTDYNVTSYEKAQSGAIVFLEKPFEIKEKLERDRLIQKAENINKRLQSLNYRSLDTEERDKIVFRVREWINKSKSFGQTYDDLLQKQNKLTEIIESERDNYPSESDLSDFMEIKSELSEIARSTVDDQESILFKKSHELIELTRECESSLFTTFIAPIKNDLPSIKEKIKNNDPAIYFSHDPNHVDPPGNISDPNEFVAIAKKHIEKLNKIQEHLEEYSNSESLLNALSSPIDAHNNEAARIKAEINDATEKLKNDIEKYRQSKNSAEAHIPILNLLVDKNEDIIKKSEHFIEALKKYGELKNDGVLEQLWLRFSKTKMIEYYEKHVDVFQLQLRGEPYKDLIDLYKAVKDSRLSEEDCFKPLLTNRLVSRIMEN